MANRKRNMLVAAALVVVAAAFVWRMWPHSLADILDSGEEPYDAISVSVTEFGAPGGSLSMEVYELETASLEDDRYWSVLSIVEGGKFRADFRNLLPWGNHTVSSSSGNITHSANLAFADSQGDWVCHITFHGDRTVSVSVGDSAGFLIYHPTDRDTLSRLVAYVKDNQTSSWSSEWAEG